MAVKLAHCDRFGVYCVGCDLVVAFGLQSGQRSSQDAMGLGFATTGRADEHKAVTDLDCVVKLDYFG